MAVFVVEVDVATARPPAVHATIRCVVDGHNALDAELIACQLAHCHPHVVMAVGSRIVNQRGV